MFFKIGNKGNKLRKYELKYLANRIQFQEDYTSEPNEPNDESLLMVEGRLWWK